jgi:hypothetical protein
LPRWAIVKRKPVPLGRNESAASGLNFGSVPREFVMRPSGWTPSIVPHDDQSVYLVVDDLGRLGRVWREADFEKTDLETVIQDLLNGQYSNPIRVFGFNAAEGWARDVSGNVARELRLRCHLELRDLPGTIKDFVERHEGDRRQLPSA